MKIYRNPDKDGYVAEFTLMGHEYKAFITRLDDYYCTELMVKDMTKGIWTDYCRRWQDRFANCEQRPTRVNLYLGVLDFSREKEIGLIDENGEYLF